MYSGDSDERVKWLVYTLEQASRVADASAGGCLDSVWVRRAGYWECCV